MLTSQNRATDTYALPVPLRWLAGCISHRRDAVSGGVSD